MTDTLIKDLRDGMRRVDVIGMITDPIPKSRTVNLRTGGTTEVVEVGFDDVEGHIILALWDDQIKMAEVGKKYRIENGYTSTFQSKLHLNVGKYGKFIPLKG